MTQKEYDKVVQILTEDRKQVAEGKREDYTKGDEDVLKNFKNQAEALGVDPKVSLSVHMEKQFSAILNYVKTDGESESEPIIKRIGDCINYLELLWGLINEEKSRDEFEEAYEETKNKVPSFCDTPNACHYDGCMCKNLYRKKCIRGGEEAAYEDAYIVDNILCYGDIYEVQSGDEGAQFQEEEITGVNTTDESIVRIELKDGRVYKTKDFE